MDLEIHHVAPSEFVEVAAGDRDAVLVCAFEQALTADDVAAHATKLASVGNAVSVDDIRMVRYEPSVLNSTALSLEPLAPHTDGAFLESPPRQVILSCTKADQGGGGISTLFSASFVAQCAPDWARDALREARYRFVQSYDGDTGVSFVGPVLWTSDDGRTRIRWRGDHLYLPEVVDARGTRADDAVRWLYEFFQTSRPLTYLLDDGELMLTQNDLVVHGRLALSPDSRREVLRTWIF
jgi:hypothetical protein